MNKYFGIGFTSAINKSLTVFFGESMLVIHPLRMKYYYYDKNQHKPTINLFVGIITGDIYPDDIE